MSEDGNISQKVETPMKDHVKEEILDLVPKLYSQHGGDPRLLDISHCVLISRLPTDFLADTFVQFTDCIKNMLSEEHKLDPSHLKSVVRIPKLEHDSPNQSNALRALLCFTEKTHKYRMMGRKKDIESSGMKLESLEELPAELLEMSEEDIHALADFEITNDVEDEEVVEEVEEKEREFMDSTIENSNKQGETEDGTKKEEESDDNKVNADADETVDKKIETPKKKVYEDEDEKAPYEMHWDGAPEFQWRLCDTPRDEKKLIIDNLMWADLNNVFIYRTIQKATSCDINFPMRFAAEGTKPTYGKLTLYFPGFVAIMDEALKHLIYFRSGDGRRIKVFLPQTAGSLKRKEEFEGKLGRLIKPTPRMMELVIKILPDNYTPNLDDACAWFPYQAVIECVPATDEMGKPCAIVKFETAEEAVAAHAGKSFVNISEKVLKTDSDGNEVEQNFSTNCNVFMRGVEAHFGSLLTFYDQRKKIQDQRANRKKTGNTLVKRPAGSTIRGPAQKRRAPSPAKRANIKEVTPRGSARGGASRTSIRGGGIHNQRRPSSPRGGRGGRQSSGLVRTTPRSTYRHESYSTAQRGPVRTDAFSGYGYANFENRFNERPSVDPFGRPVYNNTAFTTSFHRDESSSRSYTSFQDRRRY
ncbi:unnamed protein product [Caenorhabditis sp. 36 PRJEB53466]|nr:unnamed protein product [Caenorhabditis sp. 36 PRJEB53466]